MDVRRSCRLDPAVLIVAIGIAALPAAAATTCESLANLALPDATVTAAESIVTGSYKPSGSNATIGNLPPFCRVHGVASPVPGSTIGFEVWMPLASAGWNGKLEMLGNGGYSSAISWGSMGTLLQGGYAAVGTDTGHTGDDPVPFLEAVTDPEVIVDWGNRAVHESVVSSKLVVAAFYGNAPIHSYFSGCSTGGHQALMEAQRYPTDFDGIIAGDPGNNRTHLNLGFLWQFVQNHPQGDSSVAGQIVPASKLPLIAQAAVAACKPAEDGGAPTDNFLSDPRGCQWDPAAIQCTGADAPNCLTPPQVAALRKMYGGARDSRTGHLVYPGWPRGSEGIQIRPGVVSGWNTYWGNVVPGGISMTPTRVNFWRYWAFGDANWDWWKFDWDRDIAAADDKLAPIVNAMSPDLKAFEQNGGRLIQYHGFADPVVAPDDSIGYYQRVVAYPAQGHGQGLEGNGRTKQVQKFYRLFMVPGMGHCGGGNGPNVFDTQTALEDWVEQGIAPERIVATKYVNDSPSQGVSMTRPLCPYPQLAVYTNSGSTDKADSFACVDGKPEPTQLPAPEYLR
jgi:feruloyl esterase